MIKTIMRDPMFLAQKSENATEVDAQVVTDLLDTLRANLDHCVGMAANMIGVRKNIISLEGVRPCTRYEEIEVDYLDSNFRKQHGKYTGWTAQIIQHEVDHCCGVVI